MKNTLKITSTILCCVIAFYACNSTPNLTSKNEVKVEDINSIDDLIKYGNTLTKPEDRYTYYKQLCKLQKAQEWQADKRMKYVPIAEILNVIDTLYNEFEGSFAEEDGEKNKFSNDIIGNTSFVKKLDSLFPINKAEFTSMLESGFYAQFFSHISIENFNENDTYTDKKDERLVNPNFLTFSYFKCEACGGYQERYFLLNNGKLKKLDLEPFTEKEMELLDKKINDVLGLYGQDGGIGYMNKILKIKEDVSEIYLNVRGEGGTKEDDYQKYPKRGELKYQIKDYKTIIPNTVEFYSERTGKWYKL